MQSMALFDLASRQSQWLTQRQTVIAGNIANANTPGFKAREIKAFDAAMDAAANSAPSLTLTHPMHLAEAGTVARLSDVQQEKTGEVLQSGNDVDLEQEFLKTGEIMKTFNLNNQIVKAFNRMLYTATKV